MREEDIGKVFLFALPWDWTWVGRFKGFVGDMIELTESGYFTRTGATFDVLCKHGLTAETQFHAIQSPDGYARVNGHPNVVIPWESDWPARQARGG